MVDPGHHSRSRLFRYRARNLSTGAIQYGETTGQDAYTVRSGLRAVGLEVETIRTAQPAWRLPPQWIDMAARWRCQRRLSQRADLADAIGSLLGAGIPLERVLSDLGSSTIRDRDERRMLLALRDGIRDGGSLDRLAAAQPDWFDPIDVAMLGVGQRTGDLHRVLQDLSRSHQRGSETGHKLLMALSYPLLLLVAAIGVVAFIGTSTLPALIKILVDAHVHPPALTLIVAQIGQILVGWWWALAGIGIGATWLVRRLVARLSDSHPLFRWFATTPVARARQRLRVAAIAGVLAQLLRNGVTLAEAIETTAQTTAAGPLRALLMSGAESVKRGEALSTAIGNSRLLDPEFAQLLRVGEQAGELPELCQRVAERYERAAQRALDRLAAIAEPAAILAMAAVVGVVVMAAILPLIALGDIL